MKKVLLLCMLSMLSGWFTDLECMIEPETAYEVPGYTNGDSGDDRELTAQRGSGNRMDTARTDRGSVGAQDVDSSMDSLTGSFEGLLRSGSEHKDVVLASPTVQPVVGNTLEQGSSRESSGSDEGGEKEENQGEDFEFGPEEKTSATKQNITKKQKPKRTHAAGMSSFGGSIGSGVVDKAVKEFFQKYSDRIQAVLQKDNVRLLGEVDSLKDSNNKALARCLISCLKCYDNKNGTNEKDFLFVKAKKFFIDLLFPLAILESLYMDEISHDDKQVDQRLDLIDDTVLDAMVIQGWNALDSSQVTGLKITSCGKVLDALLTLDNKAPQKSKDKVIHFWLFYFHRPLVHIYEGQNSLYRKQTVLKSIITLIKTAKYNIMQIAIEPHALDSDIPQIKWCRDEMDSVNGSWYDKPATVMEIIAGKYCGKDARKIAQFINESQGIKESGSCCVVS